MQRLNAYRNVVRMHNFALTSSSVAMSLGTWVYPITPQVSWVLFVIWMSVGQMKHLSLPFMARDFCEERFRSSDDIVGDLDCMKLWAFLNLSNRKDVRIARALILPTFWSVWSRSRLQLLKLPRRFTWISDKILRTHAGWGQRGANLKSQNSPVLIRNHYWAIRLLLKSPRIWGIRCAIMYCRSRESDKLKVSSTKVRGAKGGASTAGSYLSANKARHRLQVGDSLLQLWIEVEVLLGAFLGKTTWRRLSEPFSSYVRCSSWCRWR